MKTKQDAIGEISGLLSALAGKFDTDTDAERDYLVAHCPPQLRDTVPTLSTLALHLLADIAEGAVSVVGLSARSGQLKGTVSKQVQRLVDAGLVRRDPVPGNRKEVRLTPTPDGQVLAGVHRRMHGEMAEGQREFLARYTRGELDTVITILRDLLVAEKRGVRLHSAGDVLSAKDRLQ